MEFSNVLPENERTSFPDPMRHVRVAKEIYPDCGVSENATDATVTRKGQLILDMLRQFKYFATDLDMKMTVGTAVFVHLRESKAVAGVPAPPDIAAVAWITQFEFLALSYFVTAIKFLANDGFIKLGDAEEFEKREIVQYHATAKPEFRSGKFRL